MLTQIFRLKLPALNCAVCTINWLKLVSSQGVTILLLQRVLCRHSGDEQDQNAIAIISK